MNQTSQCMLYGFDVSSAVPTMLFRVSLGPGAAGLIHDLDCRDGMILVGRVMSPAGIINIERAIEGTRTPKNVGGAGAQNQGAYAQLFYLTDPEAAVSDHPISWSLWGARFLPSLGNQPTAWRVAMGAIVWKDSEVLLTGVPNFIQAYEPGFHVPSDSFMDGGAHVDGRISRSDLATRVTYLAVVPQITVTDGQGGSRVTNLALGLVPDGPDPGARWMVVMDEADPTHPMRIGRWPDVSPFGPGVGFNLKTRPPLVDECSKLVAVLVTRTTDQTDHWVIVDVSTPAAPKTLGVTPVGGFGYAAFSYGRLVAIDADNRLKIVEVGGDCSNRVVKIHVEFEKPKLDLTPGSLSYGSLLFGNQKLRVPARHIRVQLMNAGSTAVIREGYTDDDGEIAFWDLQKGDYTYKVLADYRWEKDGKTLAEAGVYNSDFPSDGAVPSSALISRSVIWDAQSLAKPEPSESFTYSGGQQLVSRLITAENSQFKRFSAPFNILMVYDQVMKTLFDIDPTKIPSPRMHIGWKPDDTSTPTFANYLHTVGQPSWGYARISGSYYYNPFDYTDSAIAHEFGHFVADALRDGHGLGMGGDHAECWTSDYDWTLAFNEGVATFFQAVVKTRPGYPDPSSNFVYLGAKYQAVPGGIVSISTPTGLDGNGPWREWSVARALWGMHTQVFQGSFGPSLATWAKIGDADIPNVYAWWRVSAGQPGMPQVMQQEGMLDANLRPLEKPLGCKEQGIPIVLGSSPVVWSGDLVESKDGTKWASTRYFRVDYTNGQSTQRTVTVVIPSILDLPEVRLFLRGKDLGVLSPTPGLGALVYQIPSNGTGPYVLRFKQTQPQGQAPLRTFHYQITFQ